MRERSALCFRVQMEWGTSTNALWPALHVAWFAGVLVLGVPVPVPVPRRSRLFPQRSTVREHSSRAGCALTWLPRDPPPS